MQTKKLWYLAVFLLVTGLSSCSSKADEQAGKQKTDTSYLPVVYERFEDFAPLLKPSNDTLYVINFWATWCAPCVEEMPYFETLHTEMANQKVKVILVSLDFKKDLESKVIPFLNERKLQPTVLMLADGRYNDWIDQVSPEWSGAIPATVLIKGTERRFYGEQFAGYEDLKSWVNDFM